MSSTALRQASNIPSTSRCERPPFARKGFIVVVIGNLIEPKIMGDNLELHPVVILSALIFWGMLWGVVGMFLAVPMTAILSILLARWEYTKPLADLLAGKLPNLGP